MNPNLAPDAVSITTFGPGENNPASTNKNNGRVSAINSFLAKDKAAAAEVQHLPNIINHMFS
jgi:hypothetical protein